MNRQHIGKKWGAFTLIELLVTVAIVTLLIAILLPTLRTARGAANEVYCQSNLAQQARAWMMYLDAHNGFFYQKINAGVQYGGWIGDQDEDDKGLFVRRPLNPFLDLPVVVENASEAQVFRCPCDDGGVYISNLTAFARFGTSYQMNILLADQIEIQYNKRGRLAPLCEAINLQLPGMNLSRAAEPAKLLLMGDYGWINRWTPGPMPVTQWHDKPQGYNMAFLDGHVQLTSIRKGLFVTSAYRVLPFESLDELALRLQVEEP